MEQKEERLSRAISASSRRQILRLLFSKERTVKEISTATKMSVSLASRHLKMLHDLGFLDVRKKFPNKFYSVRKKGLKELIEAYDQIVGQKKDTDGEKLSRAISASSRRQILRLLFSKERTVKEISTATKMSVSLASRHLKMLHDLGFLDVRKKFPNKFYSLKTKELKGLIDAYDRVITKA